MLTVLIGWEILETMTIRQRCLLEQAIKMVTVLMLVVLLDIGFHLDHSFISEELHRAPTFLLLLPIAFPTRLVVIPVLDNAISPTV